MDTSTNSIYTSNHRDSQADSPRDENVCHAQGFFPSNDETPLPPHNPHSVQAGTHLSALDGNSGVFSRYTQQDSISSAPLQENLNHPNHPSEYPRDIGCTLLNVQVARKCQLVITTDHLPSAQPRSRRIALPTYKQETATIQFLLDHQRRTVRQRALKVSL